LLLPLLLPPLLALLALLLLLPAVGLPPNEPVPALDVDSVPPNGVLPAASASACG
jgi:hypothetical protein